MFYFFHYKLFFVIYFILNYVPASKLEMLSGWCIGSSVYTTYETLCMYMWDISLNLAVFFLGRHVTQFVSWYLYGLFWTPWLIFKDGKRSSNISCVQHNFQKNNSNQLFIVSLKTWLLVHKEHVHVTNIYKSTPILGRVNIYIEVYLKKKMWPSNKL